MIERINKLRPPVIVGGIVVVILLISGVAVAGAFFGDTNPSGGEPFGWPRYDGGDGFVTRLNRQMAVDEQVEATLNSMGTAHNWVFEGEAGQDVTIAVRAVDEYMDPRMHLIGPSGEVLAESDDADGLDAFLRVTLPEDGLYTIRVDAWSAGRYEINLTEE